MPWPSNITQQQGLLTLERLPTIEYAGTDQRIRKALDRFAQHLSARTGLPLDLSASPLADTPLLIIHCAGSGQTTQALDEDESYELVVNSENIVLNAANPLGIMHGMETLLQLVQTGQQGWVIPALHIQDSPRFAWRGLMIDVSRHFMPIDALKRNLDGMASVKLNVLHLHLSDDEGFRVESRRCPKLNRMASGGLFYKQSQIRELLAYARARGIRVVPEFDLPGHAVSWLVAYPELASAPPPARLVRTMSDSVRPPFDPTLESTFTLLDKVIGEMAGLFPDHYFHIGGDEVDGKYWDGNPRIQAWMGAHNVISNQSLQAYFNRRLEAILRRYGKYTEGWDEILDAKLSRDTLIQSWRGPNTLAAASRMGFKSVLSAGYYLDLMYPSSRYYAVDPLGGEMASLTATERALVVGGEAAQWTEYVTPELLDNRIWPRLGVIAERLWSPAAVTDVGSMYWRLSILSRNLEWLGLEHVTSGRRMLARIAGDDTPAELLKTLSIVVEPVKEYEREKTQTYNVDEPLNHLVDAVPAESDDAREINSLTRRAFLDPSLRSELRVWLSRWRDNDAQLQPFLTTSSLREPLVPLSQNLAVLGTIGLQALESIETNHPVTEDGRKQQLAAVHQASIPHAELTIAIAPAILALVEAEPGVDK